MSEKILSLIRQNPDIKDIWDAAQKEEREACAQLCDDLWLEEADAAANGTDKPKYHDAIECAAAIRARSKEQTS